MAVLAQYAHSQNHDHAYLECLQLVSHGALGTTTLSRSGAVQDSCYPWQTHTRTS